MALRTKKNSAFLAYQLAGSDSENSADERREEQKEKQKAKKKSRTKKKNSDSAVLKDLAMCAISKPKKSKGKAAKSTTTPPPEPADEAPTPASTAVVAPVVVEEEKAPAPVPVPTAKQPQPKAAAPVAKQVETKSKPSPAAAKTNAKAAPAPQHAAKQETSAPPPAVPNGVAAPPKQQQQQHNGTDLGAIYSPTHVKITRADGQMTRTIAVSEMMDQLYLFGNQNAQLRIVQEQLTVANRSMQEQLQRDAEIINGLQNEVAMFRQMCLNLQAEVSMHRSAAGTTKPSQPAAHRPPPGM